MKQVLVILALSACVLTVTPSANAAILTAPERVEPADVTYYAQAQISPRQAKSIALSRVPGGEVVDIRRSGDTYRVRVIDRQTGRVVTVVIDANTGRVL